MVQQCIYENAHVALDQIEYKKRYDALTEFTLDNWHARNVSFLLR